MSLKAGAWQSLPVDRVVPVDRVDKTDRTDPIDPALQNEPFMKTVTVITPSYNSARFIRETLRSVAEQRSENLRVEHLIIDGGSTDATPDIVAEFAHPDTRFIVEKDDGPADAINNGLARASGEFLCWLNSDDTYAASDALARAVTTLDRHPRAAFCFGHCHIVDEHGNEIRSLITRLKEVWFPLSCHMSIRILNYISQPAMIFRRDAFLKAGKLRTDMYAAWDYEFTLRLWRVAGRGVRVRRPALACFRWTPGSISGSGFEKQFREELDCVIADAGPYALSTTLHRFVRWFIVFCYTRMTGRDGKKQTEECSQ